jgi:hypothetical protein
MRPIYTFAHRVTKSPARLLRVLVSSLVLILGGCGQISTHTRPYTTVIDTVFLDSPPDGRVLSASRWRFEGHQLVVHIDDWQTCYRTQTQILEERVEITRSVKHDEFSVMLVVLGVAVLGVAAYDWAEPTFLGDDNSLRALLVGGGLLGQTPLLVGAVRARDTDEFVARRERPVATGNAFVCADGEAPPAEAILQLPVGLVLRSPRLPDGSYRFDIPIQQHPSFMTPRVAQLTWDGHLGEPIALPVSDVHRAAGVPIPADDDPYFARRYPGPCSARSASGELTFVYDGIHPIGVRDGQRLTATWTQGVDAVDLTDVWMSPMSDETLIFDGPGALFFGFRQGWTGGFGLVRGTNGAIEQLDVCFDADGVSGSPCPQFRVALVSDGRDGCLGIPGQLACPALTETISSDGSTLYFRERFTYDRIGRLRSWAAHLPDGAIRSSAWLDWSGRDVSAWRGDRQSIYFERDEVGNVRSLRAVRGMEELWWTFDYACWEVSP